MRVRGFAQPRPRRGRSADEGARPANQTKAGLISLSRLRIAARNGGMHVEVRCGGRDPYEAPMTSAARASRIFMRRRSCSLASIMVSVMSIFITLVRSLYAGVRREIAEALADNYRPEMHYMRGPGPRWRQKHAVVLSVTSIHR